MSSSAVNREQKLHPPSHLSEGICAASQKVWLSGQPEDHRKRHMTQYSFCLFSRKQKPFVISPEIPDSPVYNQTPHLTPGLPADTVSFSLHAFCQAQSQSRFWPRWARCLVSFLTCHHMMDTVLFFFLQTVTDPQQECLVFQYPTFSAHLPLTCGHMTVSSLTGPTGSPQELSAQHLVVCPSPEWSISDCEICWSRSVAESMQLGGSSECA